MDARAVAAVKPSLETAGKERRGMTADHFQGIEKCEADLWKYPGRPHDGMMRCGHGNLFITRCTNSS
jgi:hypothetical protein